MFCLIKVNVRGTIISFNHIPGLWGWLDDHLRSSVPGMEYKFFIDRDPNLFHYVLDYVYNRIFPLQDTYEKMFRIAQELDYYKVEYPKNIWLRYLSEYKLKYNSYAELSLDNKWIYKSTKVRSVNTKEEHTVKPEYCIEIVKGDKWIIFKDNINNTGTYMLCNIGSYEPLYTFSYSRDVYDFNEEYIVTADKLYNMKTNEITPFKEEYYRCFIGKVKGETYFVAITFKEPTLCFLDKNFNLLKEFKNIDHNSVYVTDNCVAICPHHKYKTYNFKGEKIKREFILQDKHSVKLDGMIYETKRRIGVDKECKYHKIYVSDEYVITTLNGVVKVHQPPHYE